MKIDTDKWVFITGTNCSSGKNMTNGFFLEFVCVTFLEEMSCQRYWHRTRIL